MAHDLMSSFHRASSQVPVLFFSGTVLKQGHHIKTLPKMNLVILCFIIFTIVISFFSLQDYLLRCSSVHGVTQ